MLPALLLVIVYGNTDAERAAVSESDIIAVTCDEFSANNYRIGAIFEAAACRQVILLVINPVMQDVLVRCGYFVAFK